MQKLSTSTIDTKYIDVLCNKGFLSREFSIDREDLVKYRLGELENVSEKRVQEMEVLDVLEKLGFPMQDVGTYLYKNVVINTIYHLSGYDNCGRTISQRELLQQLKNPFSQFYFDVSRNDLDMGITTFHTHIERMILNINSNKVDMPLFLEIYSNFSNKTDYGENAFIIGKYMVKNAKKKAGNPYIKNVTIAPVNKVQVGN